MDTFGKQLGMSEKSLLQISYSTFRCSNILDLQMGNVLITRFLAFLHVFWQCDENNNLKESRKGIKDGPKRSRYSPKCLNFGLIVRRIQGA